MNNLKMKLKNFAKRNYFLVVSGTVLFIGSVIGLTAGYLQEKYFYSDEVKVDTIKVESKIDTVSVDTTEVEDSVLLETLPIEEIM